MNESISTGYIYLIIVIVIWDLCWRGIALWRASRNSQKYWFIALLIINSAGILPIIYLLTNKAKEEIK